MQKLLIFSHTYFKDSRTNRALLKSLENKDILVRNLDAIYGATPSFDVIKEHELLKSAKEIFVQFPMFWYSSPALFKAWQDEVLTPLYMKNALNKPVKFIITAGEKKYHFDELDLGDIKGIERFYLPQKQSFKMCGADAGADIFALYNAPREVSEQEISDYHAFLGLK